MNRIAWVFALAFAATSALSGAAAAEKYVISAEVWNVYQAYLLKIDNGDKPGAYAITRDGFGAFYVWCEETRCVAGATYGQDAVNYCEKEYDTDCVVFAVRDEIRVEYEIAAAAPPSESASSASANVAPALSAPPPVTKIAVSATVKAEINSYLANQGAGRAWALAIANDGSAVAAASCPTSGGWSGGRACEPIKGSPQELASREAVMRCGGAAACVLLYEGAQVAGNVEVVTR